MKYINTGQADVRLEHRFSVCGQADFFDFLQKKWYNIYVIKKRKEQKNMSNYVSGKFTYEEVKCCSSEKTVEAFELIMEHVSPKNSDSNFKVDYAYFACEISEFIEKTIAPSVFSALVRRGLLIIDGKIDRKYYYVITQEIYDYYVNTYISTKKEYLDELEQFYSCRNRRRNNQAIENEERSENCA